MTRFLTLAIIAAVFMGIPVHGRAADHLDSPIVRNDPASDINDLFAFVNPNDSRELVLAATVVPAAGIEARFSDAVEYRFHIDNGDDSMEIVCTFNGQGFQVKCRGPRGLVAGGPLNRTATGNGMRVHAGLFDDPFFFDFVAFNRTVATLAPQFKNPGNDFFAPLSTLAIVLGVDVDRVSNDGDNPVLQVYSSTSRTGNAGIQSGISGLWRTRANVGSGITLQTLDPVPGTEANRLYAIWNAYDDFGDQAWIFGVGAINGNSARMDAFVTDNGAFPPERVSHDVKRWGTFEFSFDSCNSGQIEFSPEIADFSGAGTLPLSRLTRVKGLDCSLLSNGQIDRMGRPGINTVLIDLLDDTGLKDAYNRAEGPDSWSQFIPEIESNLRALAGLDGNPGNELLSPADLAPILADDRLVIDVSEPFCDGYLAVELGIAGQCGGRTLQRDVIDDTLGAIVGTGVSDGVDFSSPTLDSFPFLGKPRDFEDSD